LRYCRLALGDSFPVHVYVDPYNIALLCDGLKDNNLTIEWMERAYNERSSSLYALSTETVSDSLRSDPRYADLVRRIGLPQPK
jgi:hypothetical protein